MAQRLTFDYWAGQVLRCCSSTRFSARRPRKDRTRRLSRRGRVLNHQRDHLAPKADFRRETLAHIVQRQGFGRDRTAGWMPTLMRDGYSPDLAALYDGQAGPPQRIPTYVSITASRFWSTGPITLTHDSRLQTAELKVATCRRAAGIPSNRRPGGGTGFCADRRCLSGGYSGSPR